MSKILTRSIFYFGTKITRDNRGLDFSEGAGPEINALLKIGDYTLTTLAAEVQRVMRESGALLYDVNVDRATRVITISAPSAFNLLIDTGAQTLAACWATIGFIYGADQTGLLTYDGTQGAGSEYITQYPVRDYISERDWKVREDATFQVTPSGVGQSISFGNGSRIRMNITLITNILTLQNTPFYPNATGVTDFLDFIEYCMDKNKVEFMPDVADRDAFVKVFLESTSQDKNAFEFNLRNLSPDIHESGALIFRKVLV